MDEKKGEYEPSEEDVKHIQQWLHKMPHLLQDYDDHILKSWIIGSKGSLQKVKEAIETINSLGLTYPNMFDHLDPFDETTQYCLSRLYLFPMPAKTDDGCIIMVAKSRGNEVDSAKFSVREISRFIFMAYMVLLYENNMGASKVIFVYDCENTGLAEVLSLTPKLLAESLLYGRNFPIRWKRVLCLKAPYYLQPVLTFVRSLIPKKLSDRAHLISCTEELHDFIPKKFLPKELGGDAENLDTLHESWKKKVESYRDRLISENNKMRQLDHIRPKTANSNHGSFKKLDVD